MYILSFSSKVFKIKFVRNSDLPHSEGLLIIHLITRVGYHHYSVFKVLITAYIIKLIKHKKGRSYGNLRNNVGILISILFSLPAQLVNVILS